MNKITKKLFKVFIKPIVKKRNVQINAAIPKYELAEKNIKNARLITPKLEILKLLLNYMLYSIQKLMGVNSVLPQIIMTSNNFKN
jgi:hypothetical protein